MAAKVLIIRALEACNAGCFMCEFAFSRDAYRLTRDEFRRILTTIQGSDIRLVRFTGGEPLLLQDLAAMIADAKASGKATSIISNGWYLQEQAQSLAKAGLDQIIVSIDGPSAHYHDKFRRSVGLFGRALKGISELRDASSTALVRVNTVVGPHNIHLLGDMWDLLSEVGVEQWSVIPLKNRGGAWGNIKLLEIEENMERFRNKVMRQTMKEGKNSPHILGYGLHLFGRSEGERARLWSEGRNITPSGMCHLIDEVLYFTPKDGLLYPCNCIPHRAGETGSYSELDFESIVGSKLVAARDWLRVNGPKQCTGCEPINAALGDREMDLDHDPFGF